MLVRQLEARPNVRIARGWELAGLHEGPDAVTLRFAATDDGRAAQTAEARYVIGADGARSRVRDLLGIGQSDLGFSYDWLVVDVLPHVERVWHPYVVQHCDPARPTTLVNSGPGRRRWEFMVLPGETIEALNTPEAAWRLLAPWDITPDNATLERHAVYTFRGSWADWWQEGRVFLAGDAAHLMPPFLGQGLCSGMRDAKALSWRLAAISRDGASPALLDSYGPERTAHVQEIIRQAVEMGRIICMLDPVEVAERDDRMKAAIRNPALALQPPPEPRLGDGGAFRAGDPHAGCLAVQGRVRRDGREGLLDDIAGAGWQLLLRDAEGESALDGGARETARRLGVVVADFGAQGDLEDVDGSYAVWFDRLGAEVVLVRPDFHIFGTGAWADAGALLVSAQALLETGAAPIAA